MLESIFSYWSESGGENNVKRTNGSVVDSASRGCGQRGNDITTE